MDIIFSLLSMLKKDDKVGTIYRLRVKTLEELTGRSWNYQRLLESTSNLRSREYHIEDKKQILQVGLLASALYIKGEGIIELEISERLRPYLIDLKNNFTSYRLQAVFSLSSKFAKRIYQICSQWKDIGETPKMSLHNFKVMLSLKDPTGKEPEQYEKISAFKKYVLDTAVNQINENTDLRISYELFKKGRNFEDIRLYVKNQIPQQIPIPFEEAMDDAKLAMARQHLDTLEIKDPVLIKKILDDPKLIRGLFDFIYKMKTERIKPKSNPGGLFLTIHGLK